MAMAMFNMNDADVSELPDYLQPFCHHHANILQKSTRIFLGNHLNPPRDVLSPNNERLQDWRGLAEVLEFAPLEIDNIGLSDNATDKLFGQWIIRPDATIGHLLAALHAIERIDVLRNDTFRTKLEYDVRQHEMRVRRDQQNAAQAEPVQVAEVASTMEVDEFKNITINEVDGNMPEYFDAFVCYTSSDFGFVQEMMHKLEKVHGLKLFVPQRDLVAGCAYHIVMTKLIKERCRKMIIILSPDYTRSSECDFQTRFAFSLAPGAKEKKLIPVIIKQCIVPSILNHICLLDYTKCDVIDWFWERLAKSLKKDCEYTTSASAILGSFHTNTGTTTQFTGFQNNTNQSTQSSGIQSLSSGSSDFGSNTSGSTGSSIFGKFGNTAGTGGGSRSSSPRQGTSSSTVSTISDGCMMGIQASTSFTNMEMLQMQDTEEQKPTKTIKKKQGKINIPGMGLFNRNKQMPW